MVGVEAAEEAKVPLLLFLVLGLLGAFERGAESEEQGEKCVSVGGWLNEALVFDAGCRGACGVSSLVLVLLVVGDCLAGRSFLFLSAFWVDVLQFPGLLGASCIGLAGPAELAVAAVDGPRCLCWYFFSTICCRCIRGRRRLGKRGKSVCRLEVG